MDPQLKSFVTSGAMTLAGAIATWLVAKGIITSPDIDSTTSAIGTVITLIIGVGIAYYKAQTHTPDAIITAASQQPGVINVVTTPDVAHSAAHNDNFKIVTAATYAQNTLPPVQPIPPKRAS